MTTNSEITETTLIPGHIYDVDRLVWADWSDGGNNEGGHYCDWFDAGRYLGSDDDGLEPLFTVASLPTSHWVARIEAAVDLDELAEAIEAAGQALDHLLGLSGDPETRTTDTISAYEDLRDALQMAMCDLPTWGPDYTGDTTGVLSWDATRVLYEILHNRPLAIEDRRDIAHSMPSGWQVDERTGEWRLLAGDPYGYRLHCTVCTGERQDGHADREWLAMVEHYDEDGDAVAIEEAIYDTSREAAEACARAVARHVLAAAASDVIRMLPGTQEQRASRIGVAQPTVHGWETGDHEMTRLARQMILALLGYQANARGKWERVR